MAGEAAVKEKEEVHKEHADYNGKQTEKSPFQVLDEVQAEGNKSFADIANSAESEYEEERLKAEGPDDKTGIKSIDGEEEYTEQQETADEQTEAEETEESEINEESDEQVEDSEEESEEEEVEESTSETPQWLKDKLKDVNPDLDTDNEEDVQKALDELSGYKDQVQDFEKKLEAEREANKEFYNLLEGDEALRDAARYMYKHGKSLQEALTALDIQPEKDLETLKKEDPDAYLEAVERRKKIEQEKEEQKKQADQRQQELQANQEKTKENVDAFKEANDLDDKDFEAITEQINPQLKNLANGLVTKDFLQVLHNGVRFEQAVENAREEGIKEGKNMNIDEQRKRKAGDGLPRIDSGSTRKAEKEKTGGDLFSDALDEKPLKVSEIE